MEKENTDGAIQGDRPSLVQAKKILTDMLTKEQEGMSKDHPDWMLLEDMKENILIESDPQVISSKLKILAELLETLSFEKLSHEARV
jgi:hypothetical protein